MLFAWLAFRAQLYTGYLSQTEDITFSPVSYTHLDVYKRQVLLLGLITPLYIYLSICYLTSEDYFAVFGMIKEATSSIQKPIVSEYYFGFIFILILSFGFALIRYLGK